MLYNQDWERKSNPLVDVLLKAADLLEKHGHTKHVRQGYDGAMCLLGALDRAQGHHPMMTMNDTELTHQASQVMAERLKLGLPSSLRLREVEDYRGLVVGWNNAKERTGQEVIDALRLTAHFVAAKQKENA